VRTSTSNVARVEVTGPYAFLKTAGFARLGITDRGLTFASNGDRGVCITFHSPVPGIDPFGRIRHPALQARGDEVTVFSRRPKDARRMLGVDAVGWQPHTEPAPVDGLAGRDGVVHLAGEPIAQRWTQESKERIRSSRELGTTRLVKGLEQAEPRPRVVITAQPSATTVRVATSLSTRTRRPGRTS
jgi:hypothetical protein